MSMDPGTTTGPLPDPTAVVVKPGLQTSEFWTTVATAGATLVVAVLALFGKHVSGTTLQPLIGAAAVLGATITAGSYSVSRGRVKAAAHMAGGGTVVSAPPVITDPGPAPVVVPVPDTGDEVDPEVMTVTVVAPADTEAEDAPPMAADDGVDH